MALTKPYYGWYIVLLSMLVLMVVLGSSFSIFGLLVIPVSREFDLSRADMNTAMICLNLGAALIAPIIGRILDAVPTRPVMFVCSLLFGGSLWALGQSTSLLVSALLIIGPLSAGLIGTGTLTVTVLIARWFKVHRGRAMTLAMIGTSLGGVAFAPVAAWLIDNNGWRSTLSILGLSVMVLLALLSLTVRDRPRPDESETGMRPPPGATATSPAPAPAGPALRVAEILRTKVFWIVGISAALGMAVPTAIGISLVPLAIERGFSAIQGGSLIAISGGSAIAGKLVFSILADKIDRTLLLTGLIIAAAVPAVGFTLAGGYSLLVGLTVLLGLTTGVIASLFYTLLADKFGVGAFGTVRGLMAPLTAVISAVGVRFIGEMHDLTGDYRLGLQIFAGIAVAAAAMMLASRSLRGEPERVQTLAEG